MKVDCVKEHIQKAVAKADKITGKNLSLPILSSLLISAKNKQLTIKATNLDLGIEIAVPAKIVSEGEIAIPSNLLNNYLSHISGRSVNFESREGVLHISSDKNKTAIKALNHEDFPIIPKINKESVFDLDAQDVVSGLKSVWYAASTSSIKPELSSVYIHTANGKLLFTATDGFRLAEKQVSLTSKKEIPPLLIPFKNVPEIIRSLEEASKTELRVTKNQIAFVTDTTYLTSRVVEGTFPDYKQIIPKGSATEAVMLKDDIIKALQLMNIFSDKFNQVTFLIQPKQKIFEVRAKNAEIGESKESVNAAISGDSLEISFNYRYITDAFQAIRADSVLFAFSGLQKALVIKGVSDSTFTYLAMPMNR
jgi:DNA polymerase-3 subunit beta